MALEAITKLITAEEFMKMDLGEGLHELVRGEIVEVPQPRPEHGRVCANSVFVLESFGRQARHGYTLGNDTAVVTRHGPDTVRGADVCYYSNVRWPRSEVSQALPPIPPDLAVEVFSPSNRPSEMLQKVIEYINAGVLMVWVVHPEPKTVVIYRRDEPLPIVLGADDAIENLPELPGFHCRVADFFV